MLTATIALTTSIVALLSLRPHKRVPQSTEHNAMPADTPYRTARHESRVRLLLEAGVLLVSFVIMLSVGVTVPNLPLTRLDGLTLALCAMNIVMVFSRWIRDE